MIQDFLMEQQQHLVHIHNWVTCGIFQNNNMFEQTLTPGTGLCVSSSRLSGVWLEPRSSDLKKKIWFTVPSSCHWRSAEISWVHWTAKPQELVEQEEEPHTLAGEGSRHKENRPGNKQNEVTAGAMTRTLSNPGPKMSGNQIKNKLKSDSERTAAKKPSGAKIRRRAFIRWN